MQATTTSTTKAKQTSARDQMVITAARWLADRGMAGINLVEIGRAVQAPRGSLYHYFPDGRDQLLREALALAGATGLRLIAKATRDADDAYAFIDLLFAAGASWLHPKDYSGGCPIAAALLSARAESPELQQFVQQTQAGWEDAIKIALVQLGLHKPLAKKMACAALIGFNGALLHAKGSRSMVAFDAGAEMVRGLLPASSK